MNKEFIPYDLALELKELGFNQECLACYDQNKILEIDACGIKTQSYRAKIGVLAPLYQQAFRWFREKYDIEGLTIPTIVEFNNSKPQIKYTYRIYNLLEYLKKGLTYGLIDAGTICPNIYFETYPEAELECLKKLIEIEKELRNMPLSTCCGAETDMTEIDICPECLEHCDWEDEDEEEELKTNKP